MLLGTHSELRTNQTLRIGRSCSWRVTVLAVCCALGGGAFAQVQCRMPNGRVVTQQLATSCPTGALESKTLDGAPLPVPGNKGIDAPGFASAAGFGYAWPLTVERGALLCDRGAIILVAKSGIFAVNGTAAGRAAKEGWGDLRSIWKDNPEVPGTKMSIRPLLDRGAEVCKAKSGG